MADLMYTPLENVFAATMEREGKTVTAWSNGKEFTAFFRRCDDGQSTEDRITVYYSVDAPVEQGSLIQYGRKTYVLINKETEENTCYYKSYGIATNGILNNNNGTLWDIPIYGYDMKDGLAYADKIFTMISGNMEFITEITDAVKTLKINDTFNVYGRTFKVDNIYMKDGLFHIIGQVKVNEADPIPTPDPEPDPTEIYTGKIEASSDTLTVGGSYKTLTLKIYDSNKNDLTENYSEATFTWTCSIGDEDYTDKVTWLKWGTFNQEKIKIAEDGSLYTKKMIVKCKVSDPMGNNGTVTVTKEFTLKGY